MHRAHAARRTIGKLGLAAAKVIRDRYNPDTDSRYTNFGDIGFHLLELVQVKNGMERGMPLP